MNSIVAINDIDGLFVPNNYTSENQRQRVERYLQWLSTSGHRWQHAPLAAYRDALADDGYAPNTISAYVAGARQRYAELLKDNTLRDALYDLIPGGTGTADRKAIVDEILTRIENGINPSQTRVKTEIIQDYTDQERRWLSSDELQQLLTAPGRQTLIGLRDTALLTLMAYTGLRRNEVVHVEVNDLNATHGGIPALHVRQGKGRKRRIVPYGIFQDRIETAILAWMSNAGVEAGRAFRRIDQHKNIGRQLSVWGLRHIMQQYPLADGHVVDPHDLRRTYAQMLKEMGMAIVDIQANLGHASAATTMKYLKPDHLQGRVPGVNRA